MSSGSPEPRLEFPITRRALLRAGTAGIAGLDLIRGLHAENVRSSARAKHVILLHQFGGPSHLDTFDMKPDAPDGIRGAVKPIATNVPRIPISHQLPLLARGA